MAGRPTSTCIRSGIGFAGGQPKWPQSPNRALHRTRRHELVLGVGNYAAPEAIGSFRPDRAQADGMTPRQKLIAKIKAQPTAGYDKPFPVVSLEDFFTGNKDLGSIGCNIEEHPGLRKFYAVLCAIRQRPEVQ